MLGSASFFRKEDDPPSYLPQQKPRAHWVDMQKDINLLRHVDPLAALLNLSQRSCPSVTFGLSSRAAPGC